MRRTIFRNMSLLTVLAVLLTAIPICFVSYMNFQEEMKAEIHREASYIATAMEENMAFAEQLPVGDRNRITVIAADGEVLYDSATSAAAMENHLERPEVQDALESGVGEAVRLSDTIDKQTFIAPFV